MATMSLLGLYQWNNLLFSEMQLPDGVDRDTMIDNLLAETAELEVIYPDYRFMQAMIGRWSAKELPIWEHLLETTKYVYDPIENYNRYEQWTDVKDGKYSSEQDSTNKGSTTFEGKTEAFSTEKTDTNTDENVSAYNEIDFTPAKQVDTDSQTKQDAEQNSESETDSTTKITSTVNDSTNDNANHEGHTHGNIGVTTTQSMIIQERDIATFNIVDYIINSFKNRFCLLVY